MSFSTQTVKYGLNQFFPTDNYKSDKKLCLHYLIYYENTKSAIEWLGKHPEYGGITEPKTLLTPIHLCSITGNRVVAEKLLALPNVSLAVQDVRKWTPLHHAALHSNPEILNFFLTVDKTRNHTASILENINNGTYEDLKQLSFPKSNLTSSSSSNSLNPTVFSYVQEGVLIEGTADDYQKITGAKFTAQMHANPTFFMEEWNIPSDIKDDDISLSVALMAEYNSYCNSPPKLYLNKTLVGNGVFAATDIPKNTILVEYLGEATHVEEKSIYLIRLCNGERVRNFGPLINEGFPNCVDFPMCNIKGFPVINVIRTIREIKKNEQILWHYGLSHPVKFEKYCNLGIHECEQYFNEKNVIERTKDMNNAVKKDDWVEYRNLLSPIVYLLATTSVQILLLLKKIINKKQLLFLIDLLKGYDGRYFISSIVKENCNIVENLLKINSKDEEGEKELISIVNGWFLEFKINTVLQLIKIITDSDLKVLAFTQNTIKKTIQNSTLTQIARQLEEVQELREQFEGKKINGDLTQKLATAIMELNGPFVKIIISELIIWPLLDLAQKNENFLEKYKSLLDCHGLRKHLTSLEISHDL